MGVWLYSTMFCTGIVYQFQGKSGKMASNISNSVNRCLVKLGCDNLSSIQSLDFSGYDHYEQCDQIGLFLKVICRKFSFKSSQIIVNILGCFEKHHC